MTTWVLMIWLCASPGATGTCGPHAERVFDTRGDCMRASLAERRASVHVWTACRLRRDPPA
jgi:hypothetical protein